MQIRASGEAGEGDELFGLFEVSAKFLARSGDPAAFLDWFARAGPALAPEFARGIDPRTGPPGLAWEYRVAHRALWERDGALAWLRAAWSEVRRSAA